MVGLIEGGFFNPDMDRVRVCAPITLLEEFKADKVILFSEVLNEQVGVDVVPVPDNVAHAAELVRIVIEDGITIFILPVLDIGSIVTILNV